MKNSLKNIEEIKNIYLNMEDSESKELFIKRISYNISEDFSYMVDTKKISDIKERLKNFETQGKKLIIFGAGLMGRKIVEYYFNDIKWECFVDNNAVGEVLGLKVININELKSEYSDSIIIISSYKFYSEIYSQLVDLNFNKENIINLGEIIYQDLQYQYFDVLMPDATKRESFIDCGCFDGETSKLFMKWCNGNYSNIWAFEPDLDNFLLCKKNLNLPNCQIYNLGAFDEETTVYFKSGISSGSRIVDEGENQIKTARLDDILKDEEITFIKMDIEGAELKALKGAEKIIKEQKPKLAICVYHRPEDIIAIPKLILEYNPTYKFKLRHYGITGAETVLYAF